jgi:hypothetical protein
MRESCVDVIIVKRDMQLVVVVKREDRVLMSK